jgi:hypothetical protein
MRDGSDGVVWLVSNLEEVLNVVLMPDDRFEEIDCETRLERDRLSDSLNLPQDLAEFDELDDEEEANEAMCHVQEEYEEEEEVVTPPVKKRIHRSHTEIRERAARKRKKMKEARLAYMRNF